MKKLSLAIIIATVSISLVGCGNSGVVGNDNNNTSGVNNYETTTQDNSESNAQGNAQESVNNTGDISLDKAKEIALAHAGLTSDQVNFKRTELEFDNGVKKYEVEFYYNNMEYSYEVDSHTGNILSYEQD
ncbi:PepSY domain-containing protein [Clostridium bornimense]|uniref:PepSY domain-containing protein n=1 Tax=Clostridium bornimense TaxID=1216932 RepID=UPI001C10C5CC|nr:PepSY domain-containing protein [Clostridium bornimense]MBU5315768.1 PepSY domain-containing protein [Clostridium bornimense]